MPGPSRRGGAKSVAVVKIKKNQRLQDVQETPDVAAPPITTTSTEVPVVYKLPPGQFLPYGSLSARDPIDPITQPLRNAALFKEEARIRSCKHLEAAAEWRSELKAMTTKWMDDHHDEATAWPMRRKFKGWVELEADPDYFTVMMKRLGIERAKVVEVQDLDTMLSEHHCLKYGIMFLSPYHDEEIGEQVDEVPKRMWFSNQVVDNACATLALLNIVYNVRTLEIGENLRSFKNFTRSFNPIMKGEALANFDWCRKIHNGFAKRTEMMAENVIMQEAANDPSAGKSKAKGKAKSRSTTKAASNKNTANHYIAYVPYMGDLWKLDGMDMHPRKMGPLENGEGWINTVRDDIRKRMALFSADASAGYTVLAVVEDKLLHMVELLGHNVTYLNWVEEVLTEKRKYKKTTVATNPEDNQWEAHCAPIRGPDTRWDLTQQILEQKGVRMTFQKMQRVALCSEEFLTAVRLDTVREQLKLRAIIEPLRETRAEQVAKYKDRQFDYGPVILTWLRFLAENGDMESLIDEFERDGDDGW